MKREMYIERERGKEREGERERERERDGYRRVAAFKRQMLANSDTVLLLHHKQYLSHVPRNSAPCLTYKGFI